MILYYLYLNLFLISSYIIFYLILIEKILIKRLNDNNKDKNKDKKDTRGNIIQLKKSEKNEINKYQLNKLYPSYHDINYNLNKEKSIECKWIDISPCKSNIGNYNKNINKEIKKTEESSIDINLIDLKNEINTFQINDKINKYKESIVKLNDKYCDNLNDNFIDNNYNSNKENPLVFLSNNNNLLKIISEIKYFLSQGITNANILSENLNNINNINNSKNKIKNLQIILHLSNLIENFIKKINKIFPKKSPNSQINHFKKIKKNLNSPKKENFEILNIIITQINKDSFKRKSIYNSLFKNCENSLEEILNLFKKEKKEDKQKNKINESESGSGSGKGSKNSLINNLTNNINFNINFNVPKISDQNNINNNNINIKHKNSKEKILLNLSKKKFVSQKNFNNINNFNNNPNIPNNNNTINSILISNSQFEEFSICNESIYINLGKNLDNKIFFPIDNSYNIDNINNNNYITYKNINRIKNTDSDKNNIKNKNKDKNKIKKFNKNFLDFSLLNISSQDNSIENCNEYNNKNNKNRNKKRAKSLDSNVEKNQKENKIIIKDIINNNNKTKFNFNKNVNDFNSLWDNTDEIINSINLPISKIKSVNLINQNKNLTFIKRILLSHNSKNLFKRIYSKKEKEKEKENDLINMDNIIDMRFDFDINGEVNFLENNKNKNNINKSFDFLLNKSEKNFIFLENNSQNKNREEDCEFEINDINENYKPNYMQIKTKKFFSKF